MVLKRTQGLRDDSAVKSIYYSGRGPESMSGIRMRRLSVIQHALLAPADTEHTQHYIFTHTHNYFLQNKDPCIPLHSFGQWLLCVCVCVCTGVHVYLDTPTVCTWAAVSPQAQSTSLDLIRWPVNTRNPVFPPVLGAAPGLGEGIRHQRQVHMLAHQALRLNYVCSPSFCFPSFLSDARDPRSTPSKEDMQYDMLTRQMTMWLLSKRVSMPPHSCRCAKMPLTQATFVKRKGSSGQVVFLLPSNASPFCSGQDPATSQF